MCIVFLAISEKPKEDGFKVIIGANRDEFFDRPTRELLWWKDMLHIISGVDLEPGKEGGTWLGISKTGRIGILTNYRQDPSFKIEDAKGRGNLVSDFLKTKETPREYLENIQKCGHEYDGFNLIVGNVFNDSKMDFSYYCNKEHKPFEDLKPGIYGISNRYLDYKWKKVVTGKERFEKIVVTKSGIQEKIEKILEMLQDETRHGIDEVFRGPEDGNIPDVFLEPQTAISVYFPEANYGTRTNSVIAIDDEDNVTFVERTMVEPVDARNVQWRRSSFQFKIESRLAASM